MRFIISLILISFVICGFSQTKKDSVDISLLVDSIMQQKVYDAGGAKMRTEKLIQRCRNFSDKKYLGRSFILLGTIYDNVGEYQRALEYYDSAFVCYTKMNFMLGVGQFYNNKGLTLKKQNRFSDAMYAFTNGFKIADSLRNERLISQLSNNLGILYNDMELPNKALPFLEKAVSIHRKNNNVAKLGMALQNLAVSYELSDNFDKAISVYRESIKASESVSDSFLLSYSYDNLAGLYFKRKQYKEAYDLHLRALSIAKQVTDSAQLSLIYNNLSQAAARLGKKEEQFSYAGSALAISQKVSNRKEEIRAYSNLSEYYSALGDYKKALELKQKENNLVIQMFTETAASETSEAMVKYQTEKAEREGKLLEQKNAIIGLELEAKEKENQLKNRTIILLIILIALSVAVVLFIFFYTRMKREKEKLESLQLIREERERISRDLHDNIGSQISFIIRNLEWMQNEKVNLNDQQSVIHSVNSAGRDLMQSIRETIWALKNDRITLESFCDRVFSSLKRYNEGSVIKVRIRQDLRVNHSISALESLNLLRIIQEAVNNAFKYSGGSEITIRISADETFKYVVTVEDNGTGFDQHKIKSDSYGMENMKFRSEEVGASFEMQSKNGTTITIKKKYND